MSEQPATREAEILDAELWPYLASERFLWLAAAAALAGLVRGFSGFGAAMVFVPLAGVVVRPEVAVPLLFVADNLATLHITMPSFRRCCWAEILPLAAGAGLPFPLGHTLQVSVVPDSLLSDVSVGHHLWV